MMNNIMKINKLIYFNLKLKMQQITVEMKKQLMNNKKIKNKILKFEKIIYIQINIYQYVIDFKFKVIFYIIIKVFIYIYIL